MADNLQKTPRELSIEKGEQITVAVIVYFLVLEIMTLAIEFTSGQAVTAIDVFRFLLTVLSGFFLYKGQNWARLLLTLSAGLLVFRGAYATYLAIINLAVSFIGFMFLLVTTIISAIAAYYLIFSSDLDAFLKSQKT